MKEKYSKLREELAYITIRESFKNRSLHKECEHNINVLLGYKEVRPGMNIHNNVPVYKCLFCETEKNSNVEIKNSIIINAANYCKDNYDMNKKEDVKSKFDVVRSVILDAVSQSAEITNEELQTMFNQNFNGRSYIKEK